MIQFPETARAEWQIVANSYSVTVEMRKRIERDVSVERELERLRVRHAASLMFDAEQAAENTPALEMLTLADYRANPTLAPGDLIEGVIKDESLCLMLGPSGSGKSTLALQMLNSLMTGEDWLSQPVAKIQGAVGALSYDMAGSMMLDWMSGFPNIDPAKVSVVNAYKQGNPLAVPAHRAAIASQWKALGVEVVVIDSFSASFFGHDQNDAAAAQTHYRDLKAFALGECGARSVIVIVHSTDGSPKKPRGSTVHQDVADTIVAIWCPNGQANPRQVEMTKYRQHRGASGHMTHQMNPVVITTPDDVTHLAGLDIGGMTLAGLPPPPGAAGTLFPALPDPTEAPDTDSDIEGDDDL